MLSQKCWSGEPSDRPPSFRSVCASLGALLSKYQTGGNEKDNAADGVDGVDGDGDQQDTHLSSDGVPASSPSPTPLTFQTNPLFWPD